MTTRTPHLSTTTTPSSSSRHGPHLDQASTRQRRGACSASRHHGRVAGQLLSDQYLSGSASLLDEPLLRRGHHLDSREEPMDVGEGSSDVP